MKTKKLSPLFLLLCLLPAISFSQTGVFWFSDTASEFVNNRIIAIKENTNGDLLLLGKASDGTFNNPRPYWAVCDKAGKLKSQTTLATTNKFYELNAFTICSPNRMRIWGTEFVNNRMTISLNTINAAGEIQGTDAMMTNTATLTGDVCQVDAQFAVLAKTVQSSSTGKYHISLYKYNVQTDAQTWYKTLPTDDNEEASKVFVMKDGSIIVLGKLYNEQLSAFKSLMYKLDANGEMVWRKTLSTYSSFYAQGVSEGKTKGLIYSCSWGNEAIGECGTQVFSLDSNGALIFQKEIENIRANGVLTLANGNTFLYGSRFVTTGDYIVSKAAFKIFDGAMKEIKDDQMGTADGPDAVLQKPYITQYPTASDFITAIQLADGRIACGGRVYMPFDTSEKNISESERYNRALLVIMNANGEFRK